MRLAVGPDGHLQIGRSLPGRGAWLCLETAAECGVLAARRRRLASALRRQVSLEAIDRLLTELHALSR